MLLICYLLDPLRMNLRTLLVSTLFTRKSLTFSSVTVTIKRMRHFLEITLRSHMYIILQLINLLCSTTPVSSPRNGVLTKSGGIALKLAMEAFSEEKDFVCNMTVVATYISKMMILSDKNVNVKVKNSNTDHVTKAVVYHGMDVILMTKTMKEISVSMITNIYQLFLGASHHVLDVDVRL